ncbi:MAG: ABC transporter permease [Velocimicrobium sp.]
MKQLKLEFIKNKLSFLILITALFLAFNFIWSSYGLRTASASEKHWGFMMILYQMPILNAILSPCYVAVIASRIADVEHKGETLKLLYTLQSRASLYHAKLGLGALLSLLLSIGQALIVICIGLMFHFENAIPFDKIALYFLLSFFVTFASYILQLNLSLLIRNQMVSLSIGVIGSFCGLFMMFLNQFPLLQYIVLWTNYVTLTLSELSKYDSKTRYIEYAWRSLNPWGLLSVALWILVLYVTGRHLFNKKEV